MPPMEGKKDKKDKEKKKRKMGDKKSHRNAASSPTVSLAGNGGGHRRLDKSKSALKESEGEYVTAFSTPIPSDDVTFATAKRIHRTAEPNVPADVMRQKLPPHVRDCLGVFSKDWQVCQYASRGEYGHGTVKGIEREREDLLHLEYDSQGQENEEEGGKGKVKTTLDHFDIDGDLSVPPTVQDAQKEVKRLNKNRYNIFRLYGMDSARVSDPRPMKPTPMSDQTGLQVLLELKDFRMQVEDVDVFYGSAALYNLSLDKPQNRGRLSELFHFTLTDSSRWGSETDFRPGPISRESLARKAMFSIDKPSPELFIVFRFEKILWGDVAHATDFYTRTNIKPKEYMKLRNEGVERAGKLGKFSQSFVCAAIQLFPEGGAMMVGKERPLEHSITNLLRMNNGDMSDDALFSEIRILTRKTNDDQLSKSLLGSRSRKSKNLPGKIVCNLLQVLPGSEIRDRVTPSLIPVSPFNSTTTKVIREIQAFTLDGPESASHNQSPFLSYVHHLYVYPESLNFSSYDGSSSARNLCCEVMLKVDDVDETPRPLPVIAGRAVMSNLVPIAITSVQYHEQRPHFFEEVRISLPPELLTNHHLLFVFKHINCALPKGKKGKESKEKMEDIAAYAWIRVLDQENNILADGDYDLSCAVDLPQRYLSADPSTVKWVDKQREVSFNFFILLVSC